MCVCDPIRWAVLQTAINARGLRTINHAKAQRAMPPCPPAPLPACVLCAVCCVCAPSPPRALSVRCCSQTPSHPPGAPRWRLGAGDVMQGGRAGKNASKVVRWRDQAAEVQAASNTSTAVPQHAPCRLLPPASLAPVTTPSCLCLQRVCPQRIWHHHQTSPTPPPHLSAVTHPTHAPTHQ